jgi:hypothetical protein
VASCGSFWRTATFFTNSFSFSNREMLWADLELQLRAFLLRIHAANSLLQPLPEDSKFSIVVDMEKPVVPTSLQEKKVNRNFHYGTISHM